MEVQMAEKIIKAVEKADETPVQKLARFDAERAEILASAKADALKKASEAVDELNALGFNYELTEKAKATSIKKGHPADAECPICTYRPRRRTTSAAIADKRRPLLSPRTSCAPAIWSEQSDQYPRRGFGGSFLEVTMRKQE